MSQSFRPWGAFFAAIVLSGTLIAQAVAPPAKKKHSKPVPVAPAASQADVQALRDLVQKQQKQLEAQNQQVQQLQDQLHQVLDAVQQSNASAQKLQAGAEQAQATATQAQQSAAEAQHSAEQASATAVEAKTAFEQKEQGFGKQLQGLESSVKKIGPFNFSGDIRLRDEPFFGGPADQSQVRNRERVRLRINANAKLNNDLSGGFTIASGDINDPISTNQTLNQFYTRKAIGIDKMFINYNPHVFKALTLTGGKFAYPWYNTELTWDKDLNPEGVAQTLAFNFDSSPVFKKFALVGFELPFTEVAGTSITNKSIVQSAVYGGQVQTIWQFGSHVKFGAYSGFYNYHDADPIALALAKASLKNPTTPLVGTLPLGGNTVQNSIYTTTQTGIVTVTLAPGPPPVTTTASTGVNTVTNAQFASKFGLFDSLARFDISTPKERWPLAFIGDYVQNTRACDNLVNILPAPVATKSATFSRSLSAPCVSRERRGYWGEGRVGRAQKKGDLQFAYTRLMIEREAVMGAFNFSDIRQPSNVTQHRAEVLYQAYDNLQLAFTGFIGRPLNWDNTKPKPPEDFLQRYQFDVVYKF